MCPSSAFLRCLSQCSRYRVILRWWVCVCSPHPADIVCSIRKACYNTKHQGYIFSFKPCLRKDMCRDIRTSILRALGTASPTKKTARNSVLALKKSSKISTMDNLEGETGGQTLMHTCYSQFSCYLESSLYWACGGVSRRDPSVYIPVFLRQNSSYTCRIGIGSTNIADAHSLPLSLSLYSSRGTS